MSLLETQSLCIGYPQSGEPDKVLQQDISVAIRPGEIVSLMGQNGVGKTTFVKTISGLIPKLGGEVFYQNDNLSQIDPGDLARRLSIVLTEKPYSHNISVTELIAIGRHPYSSWLGMLSRKDREVIDWAISETHINYLANKKLYELSDGQLQKVMIARALAQETDLILLDEPGAHLDLYNKIEVMMLLRNIAKKGKGILISTHDMQISTQLSDRLWLFNFNEPVIEGIPEDLILDGTLEKTLYLQGYGYDMIYGTVADHDQPSERKVMVEAPENVKYWVSQALKRNGISVTNSSATKIKYQDNKWCILQKDGESFHNSIEEMMKTLLNSYHHTS